VKITLVSTQRPKPQAGDTKMVRGVLMIRQQERVSVGPYSGAYVFSNGRPVYEWVAKGGPRDRTAQQARKGEGE
jgi:hypothetical protein